VRLVIYNILGQEVRVLVNTIQPEGQHLIQWDGRDGIGRHVATGMYMYRIVAGRNAAIRKMTFTK
jgi:flagellar hook assembly protein FlgD